MRRCWALACGVWWLVAATSGGQEPPPLPFPVSNFESFANPFRRSPAADDESLRKVAISAAEEVQVGRAGADAFRRQLQSQGLTLLTRGDDIRYVGQLLETVRPQMQNAGRYRAFSVTVVDSDQHDARVFPGGQVFVFRGMLDFADSEAALIGVLGHELSHLDRQHQLADLKRMKLAQQTFAAPHRFSPEQAMRAGFSLMAAFARPFRPEDEAQADADATTWTFQLGYDPREFSRLFARLNERHPEPGFLPSFLRTHPYHLDRLNAVEQRFAELSARDKKAALYIGRANLRRRLPRSAAVLE